MRTTTTSRRVLAAVPASPLLRRGSLNRLAIGAAAVGILGAVAATVTTAGTTAPADAAPAPCTAAGLTTTASGVLGQAGGFLNDHPEANDVLTAAASMPADQAKSSVQGYFVGHLDQLSTLQGIAQPLTDLKEQCGIAVSPTQLAMLLETVTK